MADQQFCLRWNNHQSTLISVFDTLLENGTLVDCTLAAEGQYLKAHKVVLSACSPYLETLLSQHYEKHPIVILKDVKFSELKSMMDYMYRGEVNISQDQLGTFLKAAESLQIKGLSDNGADGDARDVGSTPKALPPRKATQPAPSSRPEPVRPDSPLTDGSMSPSSRKRRRVRRSSQDDGDSHLDSNSCDLPSQAQSTPVPNIPAATSSITTTPIVKPAIVKPEQTDVNRIDTNSLPPESLKKEIEPISEPLLEPKTEYLEDVNNEDSVEDLTLDDDDDMEGMDISNMSNMSNMSRPGPSHGNDISNQGFAPWQLGANQSGTDEVFMAAQEAVNQHRDSQGLLGLDELYWNYFHGGAGGPKQASFRCECGKTYPRYTSLWNHKRYRCGKMPQFSCAYCDHKTWHKCNLKSHMAAKHGDKMDLMEMKNENTSQKTDGIKTALGTFLSQQNHFNVNQNLFSNSQHPSMNNQNNSISLHSSFPILPPGLTISLPKSQGKSTQSSFLRSQGSVESTQISFQKLNTNLQNTQPPFSSPQELTQKFSTQLSVSNPQCSVSTSQDNVVNTSATSVPVISSVTSLPISSCVEQPLKEINDQTNAQSKTEAFPAVV